jgi:hypothetical protein
VGGARAWVRSVLCLGGPKGFLKYGRTDSTRLAPRAVDFFFVSTRACKASEFAFRFVKLEACKQHLSVRRLDLQMGS